MGKIDEGQQERLAQAINKVMHLLDGLDPVSAYFVASFCREAIRVHFELTEEDMERAQQSAMAGTNGIQPLSP